MTFGITMLSNYADYHCTECHILLIIMLNVIKLSVIMLNVIMLSVIILNVMAPPTVEQRILHSSNWS
jgi:hypothetical protein